VPPVAKSLSKPRRITPSLIEVGVASFLTYQSHANPPISAETLLESMILICAKSELR
jgi:hypothetical protein